MAKRIKTITFNKYRGYVEIVFWDNTKKQIDLNNVGGDIDPELIQEAVEEYLDEHPVEPYDDTEIKEDISELDERVESVENIFVEEGTPL